MKKDEESLSVDDINEMDERRLQMLSDAGINEGDVLDSALKDQEVWQNYFNENLTRGKDDANFVLRDQWTAIERSEFTRLFKPAMTFSRLYDFIKKATGERRKNKPDLLVRSLTGKATQEELNLRQDLVRTISYQSENDLIYQHAFKCALLMGWGAYEIDIEYESARSFNQIIKYKMVLDPTLTAFDPGAQKPHKGDGNFCSRSYIMSKEEFFATYPYITNPESYTDPRMLLDFQWETRDTIIVNNRYVKEWYPLLIYELSNGMTVTEEEWEKLQKKFALRKELATDAVVVGGMILNEIPKIISERQTQDYRIMNYRLLKNQVIEFREWPSKCLAIIFNDGDSYYIEGRQYTRSVIHDAKDAQKFVNFVGSEIAAEIKNRRKEQWVGTPDNIIGYEQDWRNPELQMGILKAKPDPKTGQMPTKLPPWELSTTLLTNFQRGVQDIKEILGVSEVDQLQGRDISGKARRERKLESGMSTYVYFSNSDQAIEQGGRVVLDLLPFVYGNKERNVTLSKADGRSESIVLNKKMPDGTIQNELSRGDFDIEIDTGPSFAVQKEIALEFLQETLQAAPQTFNLVADLWAKNLDVQFMPQISDRFKTLVPPEILAKEEGKPPPPPQPNPEQQMMEMEMKLKEAQLMDRAHELQIREEKHQIEKARLLLDAKKLEAELKMNKVDKITEFHKSDLDYSAKIARIISDSNKYSNKKGTTNST